MAFRCQLAVGASFDAIVRDSKQDITALVRCWLQELGIYQLMLVMIVATRLPMETFSATEDPKGDDR